VLLLILFYIDWLKPWGKILSSKKFEVTLLASDVDVKIDDRHSTNEEVTKSDRQTQREQIWYEEVKLDLVPLGTYYLLVVKQTNVSQQTFRSSYEEVKLDLVPCLVLRSTYYLLVVKKKTIVFQQTFRSSTRSTHPQYLLITYHSRP